jgi:hypothetical protein
VTAVVGEGVGAVVVVGLGAGELLTRVTIA